MEHLLGFEHGDVHVSPEYGISSFATEGFSSDGITKFHCTKPSKTSSAVRNWNSAAAISSGDFLIAVADDLVPEKGWDVKLDLILENIQGRNCVLTFTDDRCTTLKKQKNDTLLPRHPLVSRKTYENLGYLFNPKFDSVGPDFDLLVHSMINGWLVDAREIKLHHSVGPVLSPNGEVICGCVTDISRPKRTDAQTRMHSNSEAAWLQLKTDWGHLEILMGKIACINRYSNYVFKAMEPDKINSPTKILLKTICPYHLDKFIYPSFWS